MSKPVFDEPDSPIIDIFKSLIANETKRNTVLTNEQLIGILQKEFAMDTNMVHTFELEVYMNVLKKYLKSWPEWDHLGQAVLNLQAEEDEDGIALLLKEKHARIRVYLSGMLDIAHEMAGDKLKEIIEKEEKMQEDVIMEVDGTAEQLRRLFFKRPLRGNIFNYNNGDTTMIGTNGLMFDSIVNWPDVEMEISVKYDEKVIVYTRRNRHKLSHTLVNKKLSQPNHESLLPSQVGIKLRKLNMIPSKEEVVKLLREALMTTTQWKCVMNVLQKVLIDELVHLPQDLRISCDFRRFLSDQKYVRYFIQEVESDGSLECDSNYDLELQEVISPSVEYSFTALNMKSVCDGELTFTCTSCQVSFNGDDVVCDILKHFELVHSFEQDWTCIMCGKVFTMSLLTYSSWQHTCLDGV